MIKPEFTEEQQNYLAEVIGHWYLHWKRGIVDDGVQHKLGYAKETLRNLIYYPENTREYLDSCFRHGMIRQALDIMKRYPELTEEKTHDESRDAALSEV